jgi:hypothetical protein
MTHEEEMRSLARGALIALLAVIAALVLHLRAGDEPPDYPRAMAMKSAAKPEKPPPQVAEAPPQP